jgi:pimeloyl-ACP methyl ester carboxylesterase
MSVRELVNRPQEQWAVIRRSDGPPNSRLAVFVHGFRGNYLSTWGKIPELLQANADNDPDLAPWDFLFLGYATGAVTTYLDIAALICTKWRQAAAGDPPHRAKYDRLALFGHSLGTLGIRQVLCATSTHNGPLLEALHAVTLFGTPLNGSPLGSLGSLIYSIGDALKPENPQLRMLKVWSKGSYEQHPWPKVRVVLGQGDWVVGQQFAELVEWPGDMTPEQTVLNHSDLVKPDAWNNCSVMDSLRTGLRL